MADPRRVAVLISGRGSNLRALVEKADRYQVVLVAANRPGSAGLDWARSAGIPTWCWDSRKIDRRTFEQRLGEALSEHRVGTVALAGFMQILTPDFIADWPGRIVNIHPSLLPDYRGLDTHARALADKATCHGCSVHVVTEAVDAGEILAQEQVPVEADDTPQTLGARVLEAEHRLYPRALAQFVSRQSLPA